MIISRNRIPHRIPKNYTPFKKMKSRLGALRERNKLNEGGMHVIVVRRGGIKAKYPYILCRRLW